MYRYLQALRQRIVPALAGQSGRRVALVVTAAALLAFSALPFATPPPARAASQLFYDDFETDAIGAFPAGWASASSSNWSVQQDGTHVLQQTNTSTASAYTISAGSAAWTDYVFQVDVKPGANNLSVTTDIMARYVDANNHYSFLLKNNSEWYLGKKVNGVWTTLAQGSFSYTNTFYTLTLSVQGGTISGSINGVTLATRTDTSLAGGMIALSTRSTSEFDNVSVTSGATPPTPTPTTSATATATSTSTATPTNTPAPTATLTPTPTPPTGALFSDDFEADALGTPPAGWTSANSSWLVQQDGTHVLQQTNTSTASAYTISAGSAAWTDYVFQVDVKPGANDLSVATVLEARYIDDNNHYSLLIKNNSEWYLGKKVNGVWTTLAQGSFSYTNTFYTLALSVQGGTISGSINGVTLATRTDTSLASGMIALSTRSTSEFDNVLVTGSSSSPTPTPTPTLSPTPTPTQPPTPTPPPGSGGASQLSVTTSSSGVTVQSLDGNLNGWGAFFNSGAGGVITDNGEIDQGVYTELEAQNTNHGRVQMYFQTSGSVWLSNLQSAATITILRNTPDLVALQTVSNITSYHVRWTTTYFIWPDGEMYVQLQAANTGTSALMLNSGTSMELDLGGLPLTYFQNQSPYAWYINSSGSVISPIPSSTTNNEARLFGHVTTVTPADMGYLLDKYTTWGSQGATNIGIAETHNTYRAKDQWLGRLSKVNPGQTLTFLFLFDQQRSLSQAQSVSIDADYRAPSVAVSVGTLATSDNEPAGASVVNGFNVSLGAYVIAASSNHVNATLGFPSGVTIRWEPRFKITGWTGGAPTVTWGGQLLTNGSDYTYTVDSTTHTLYIQLTFNVVAANAQGGQRVVAPLDIS